MKSISNLSRILTMAVAVTTLVIAPMAVLAQEKGAQLLLKPSGVNATAAATGCPAMSACPKCKDTAVTVAQPGGRGGRVENATVLRHECDNCSTRSVTTGTGKAASTQVVHVCQNTKAAACCAMNK
jgi:hypothetical protein